jgi:hypothetical protein
MFPAPGPPVLLYTWDMRNVTLAFLCATLFASAEDTTRIELSVLYVGAKDDPRTAEFTEFLSKTFTRVEAAELEVLSNETARGADVVIVDSPTPYKGEGTFDMPRVPLLGTEYTKPTILMGAAGGMMLRQIGTLKLGWL